MTDLRVRLFTQPADDLTWMHFRFTREPDEAERHAIAKAVSLHLASAGNERGQGWRELLSAVSLQDDAVTVNLQEAGFYKWLADDRSLAACIMREFAQRAADHLAASPSPRERINPFSDGLRAQGNGPFSIHLTEEDARAFGFTEQEIAAAKARPALAEEAGARVKQLEAELRRSTDHLRCFREAHPDESTTDIDASIWCAEQLLSKGPANG